MNPRFASPAGGGSTTIISYGTPSVGGHGSLIGGGSGPGAPARRAAFRLLGRDGSGGMLLGGVTYKVKSW